MLHGSNISIHHGFMQQLIAMPLFNKNEYTASDNPQTGLVGCEYNIFFSREFYRRNDSNFILDLEFLKKSFLTGYLYHLIFSLFLSLSHTFSRRYKMASSGSGFNYDDYPVIVGIDFGR